METPFKNIKILDFTRVLAGPFATMVLGDLGADIIKVESLHGDESRTWPPVMENGQSGYFLAVNRNKKSLTLNLKDQRAKDIVRKLASKMDIVIENFSPGVTKKLGIDYETLKQNNDNLIYCSISGFGQDGPYCQKKAYDPIIQGMTGLMSITGERGRSPVKVGIPVSDLVAAINAVVAIQAAYIHRLQTGKGQYVDVALYDSVLSILTTMAMEYFSMNKPPQAAGLDHIHRVPARAFESKDGKYVQVVATSDTMYPKFCKVLELEELISDIRFDTNTKRVRNRDIIMPILEKKMRERTRDEWLRLFEEADLPCGPILDLAEVFTDPNVMDREMLFTMEHPLKGAIKQLGFPYKFSLSPAKARLYPPGLGEHNEEILGEMLGYSKKDIRHFQLEKVI